MKSEFCDCSMSKMCVICYRHCETKLLKKHNHCCNERCEKELLDFIKWEVDNFGQSLFKSLASKY